MSDFSQLKSFVAVARYGSISRAAEAVHLTQPAVSLQIKQLESALGTALFTRHPLRLTDAGEHFLTQAQAILDHWKSALDYVSDEQTLTRGKLTIACSDTLMRFALLPTIKVFKTRYPGVQLSFLNRTSAGAQVDVVEGRADLALSLSDEPHPKLKRQSVLQYRDVLITPPNHPLAAPNPVAAHQLEQETLLLLEERTTSRHLIEKWLSHQPGTVIHRMSLGSVDAQIALTEAGLGLGIVPDFAVPAHLAAVPLSNLQDRQIDVSYLRLKPTADAWLTSLRAKPLKLSQ